MREAPVTAFPLAWPHGQQRTRRRERSRFQNTSVFKSAREIGWELDRLGAVASGRVISTNLELRRDGLPYSDPRRSRMAKDDPGAAVYFYLRGHEEPHCLACDRWDRVEDNLWAIVKHIEAIRGIERWGVGSIEAMFAGFKALPEGEAHPWWVVLGFSNPPNTQAEVTRAYRRKAMEHHPDRENGSAEAFDRIRRARDEGLEVTL